MVNVTQQRESNSKIFKKMEHEMSKVKMVCMENDSNDGEILRQELTTYRKVGGNLIKEKIERVFFDDGKCSDSSCSTPITKA